MQRSGWQNTEFNKQILNSNQNVFDLYRLYMQRGIKKICIHRVTQQNHDLFQDIFYQIKVHFKGEAFTIPSTHENLASIILNGIRGRVIPHFRSC